MVDTDLDTKFVSQALQLPFPQPHARAVAAAPVGRDRETACAGVTGIAELVPPRADRVYGEGRRVMVNPDADPAGVGGEVRDTIGHRPAEFLDQEVMHAHGLGIPARAPLPAGILEVSDQLLLLGARQRLGESG